jgi:glycosyltransferase involved in cell wall biosynthesis
MKMKILYVGKYPAWYEHSYGGEEHVQKIAELMAKKGHEVYLVNSVYEGEKYGITFKKLSYVHMPLVHYVEKKPFPLYPKLKEIRGLVEEVKPDIIHHFARFGFSTERLRRKEDLGITTLNSTVASRTHQRGFALATLLLRGKVNSFITSVLERYTIKNADIVITPSTEMRNILLREFKIPSGKIRVVPRGVDLHGVFKMRAWDNVAKNLVFFAGRLDGEKGVQYVIKSMEHILKEIPEAKLVIAGGGPQEHKFKKLAYKIAPGNVVFPGKISYDEMSTWYGRCNVFLMHSKFESFGAVTVEAMASGRPVVASNIGGSIDIVKNNETGILVDFGDVKGIADAIAEILKDEERAKTMGERGRKRIEEEYSWEKEADRIVKLYERSSMYYG